MLAYPMCICGGYIARASEPIVTPEVLCTIVIYLRYDNVDDYYN